ncbi:MAG: DUF2793 domain-containing protein [Hyphomicrobiaceae bacterium]|nr:MAG: DUF2793 domain-containing protein [Hyphomicrobiaceae bacterium]
MFDLTDLATLKSYLGLSETVNDTTLSLIISGVSDQILKYIGREAEVKHRVTTFDCHSSNGEIIVLPAAPIHSLEYIRYDSYREFDSTDNLDETDYDWESEQRRIKGLVKLDNVSFYPGPGVFQVAWVGGWAFDRDYYTARQDTPPVSPSNGDKYLVGASPTGAWVGKENQIATWDGTLVAWVFSTVSDLLRLLKPSLEAAALNQAAYIFRTRQFQGLASSALTGPNNRGGSISVAQRGLLPSTLDYIRQYRSGMMEV